MRPARCVEVGRPTREYPGMLSPAEVERVQGEIAEACGQDRAAPYMRRLVLSSLDELRVPLALFGDWLSAPYGQRVAR